jgi:hypothetical protein
LAFASLQTSSSGTLTNPDQATTTVANEPTPATTLVVPALPNIANRIYPNSQLDLTQNFDGYTMISILFDQQLNWPFVVGNSVSSSQIFAYLPLIISTALQIDGSLSCSTF